MRPSLWDILILIMVGLGGFEPPTSPLSGVRSNQLSYRPNSVPLKAYYRASAANKP